MTTWSPLYNVPPILTQAFFREHPPRTAEASHHAWSDQLKELFLGQSTEGFDRLCSVELPAEEQRSICNDLQKDPDFADRLAAHLVVRSEIDWMAGRTRESVRNLYLAACVSPLHPEVIEHTLQWSRNRLRPLPRQTEEETCNAVLFYVQTIQNIYTKFLKAHVQSTDRKANFDHVLNGTHRYCSNRLEWLQCICEATGTSLTLARVHQGLNQESEGRSWSTRSSHYGNLLVTSLKRTKDVKGRCTFLRNLDLLHLSQPSNGAGLTHDDKVSCLLLIGTLQYAKTLKFQGKPDDSNRLCTAVLDACKRSQMKLVEVSLIAFPIIPSSR